MQHRAPEESLPLGAHGRVATTHEIQLGGRVVHSVEAEGGSDNSPVAAADVDASERDASEEDAAAESGRLAVLGAVRMAGAPELAEAHFREAITLGESVMDAHALACLHAQLVVAVSAQVERALDLADTALRAAAAWTGLSQSDALHYTMVAARAYHRAARHGAAVALFEQALAAPTALPYPRSELSCVREEYAKSLLEVQRVRDAAAQFIAAARLIEYEAGQEAAHVRLVTAGARAMERCGRNDDAAATYTQAVRLWQTLGISEPRSAVEYSRCSRAYARLLWQRDGADVQRPWVTLLQNLVDELGELADRAGAEPIMPELAAELQIARASLVRMSGESASDAALVDAVPSNAGGAKDHRR